MDKLCNYCGAVFACALDVSRHMKRGCPEDNDDYDTDEDSPNKKQKLEDTNNASSE